MDMGLGHQRAAYPLRKLAYRGIINANNYPGMPARDRVLWRRSRLFYEFVSRFKHVPFLGNPLFELYDTLQAIPPFYPKRDLSRATTQVREIMRIIEHAHWGEHLIARLAKKKLPIVSTFFVPALMAEYYKYPGEIYCLATDTDISRAWVSANPGVSRIKYFAPTHRVADRLHLYGVPRQNIFLTGFPLPVENTGGVDLRLLRHDVRDRLANLDPKRIYFKRHRQILLEHLGYGRLPRVSPHPLMLTFAVGGAGAQRDIAVTALESLAERIRRHDISYTLIAGIHNDISTYFRSAVRRLGLLKELGKHIHIVFSNSKEDYFHKFNRVLRHTDILWSKPSELSFYTALGVPLIIAPPIGSQEVFNKRWVESVGSGVFQEDPRYTHEWLFDWLDSGWLAEAAMEGFLEAPKFGTYNINTIISEKILDLRDTEKTLLY